MNHPHPPQPDPSAAIGLLAREYCGQELPLQVLKSNAGYYIGTCNLDGPVSRESAEYFPSLAAAERAYANGTWHQRKQP